MELIRGITGRKLFKDTVALQFDVFGGILISLAHSIALTRVLGKDDYGSFALIMGIFSLLNLNRLIGPGVATVNIIAEARASLSHLERLGILKRQGEDREADYGVNQVFYHPIVIALKQRNIYR